MLTAYTAGPAWGVPDISPFVTKLLTWLRMAKVEHREQVGDLRKAPKGKLPFIEDEGGKLGDSTLIIEHLKAQGRGVPLPGDVMSPADAAIAAAFKGMIEGELYFVILYSRWVVDEAFIAYLPKIREALREMGFPSLLTPLFARLYRRQLKLQAHHQGIGRHDFETVLAMGKGYVDAIAVQLGDKTYFMGSEPGTIDATVYAFLISMTGTPLTPQLAAYVDHHENLVRYCARMRDLYWSDFVPT